MDKLYIIIFLVVTVFTLIPLTSVGVPETPTILLSILAGIGVDILIYRQKQNKEKEKAETQHRIKEDAKRVQEQQLKAGSWVFPVDALREKCSAQGIDNVSSTSNYQRVKLIVEEILKQHNIPSEYFERYTNKQSITTYFAEIQRKKRAEEQARFDEQVRQLLVEEEMLHAKCTRYTQFIGRDKSIRYCQDRIEEYRRVINECEQDRISVQNGGKALYLSGKRNESSWAIHGGIAAGIAGGAAGLAVATDVQKKNEAIRKQNAAHGRLVETVVTDSLMAIIRRKTIAEDQISTWTERMEKAKFALVEMIPEGKLLSMLNIEVAGIENSPTGAVKMEVVITPKDKLVIYDDTNATVDGSITILLKIGERIVGTAVCCFPFGGVSSTCTVKCICRELSEVAESYDISFEPHHLWAIEKV